MNEAVVLSDIIRQECIAPKTQIMAACHGDVIQHT